MPAESLAHPAESFDVTVGFAIIHHLDVERALAELHQVLKPGDRPGPPNRWQQIRLYKFIAN